MAGRGGGDWCIVCGVSAAAASFRLPCRIRKRAPSPMRPRRATPPTTPPAMAPAFVEELAGARAAASVAVVDCGGAVVTTDGLVLGFVMLLTRPELVTPNMRGEKVRSSVLR